MKLLNYIKSNFSILSIKKMIKIWNPEKFLQPIEENTKKYAIIILNRPIHLEPNYIKNLWNKAFIRVCVDGGANRWITFLEKYCSNEIMKSPELTTGDFDSITEKSLIYMKNVGSNIMETNDQGATDFTKSLFILQPYLMTENIESVIVLLDMSGRIDHIMAHINTLYKAHNFLENTDIYVLSKNSISWLLAPGKHSILIPKVFVEKEYWCAYVPIGSQCIVTTSGLKWDLENHIVQFGGIVSTSNSYSSENVTIDTTGFLYWSMGIIKDNGDDDD